MDSMSCLLCGCSPVEMHHWPRTKRFGTATIPLCRAHHTEAHWAKEDIIERIILRAPAYWVAVGEWEENEGSFDTWMSKRRVRASLSS